MRVDDILRLHASLTEEDLERARSEARSGGRLDEAAVRLGLLSEEDQLRVLGEALGLERIYLEQESIDPHVLALVPRRTVFRQQVLPIRRHNGTLTVATNDPFDVHTLDDIHSATGLHIEPMLATKEEIATAIRTYFGVGGETVGDLVGDQGFELVEANGSEDPDELVEDASVIKLVNEILTEAIDQRTSDVHIEPTRSGLRLRYRIDGVLQVQSLPPAIHRFSAAIVSRLKIMAKLNIAEKRLPQDGRIQLRTRGREVDIRVSIIPMTFGEGVVLRILDKGAMTYDLKAIGMYEDNLKLWSRLIELPHGILLVTGPTGSGKTTTLYSALQQIARDDTKIITVEDPVEYQFDRIQQIQVNAKIGLTFAAGLRSILRHDPDVVLIGEIRDLETAEISTQAALTGHLVFSTLHTNDASSAFTRLIDMGVEPFLVASTIEGVLAQRLVRKVCPECGEEYIPEKNDRPPDYPEDLSDKPIRRGAGCRSCHQTGYRGRQGIYELLPISGAIRDMCVQRASSTAIKGQGLKDGLTTLRQDAFRKLRNGSTSLAEVHRVTRPDDDIGYE